MWVKYIGRHDAIYSEYNGKKYVFSKKNPIKNIPLEVFDLIRASGHESASEIIPYEMSNESKKETVIPIEENDVLETEEPRKKRGRPSKNR